MATNRTVLKVQGETSHSLLIEQTPGGLVQLTVIGSDGKKRHASVILSRPSAKQAGSTIEAVAGFAVPQQTISNQRPQSALGW